MAKFILRRFFLLLITMLLVSMAVFLIAESSPGNVAKNVLGAFITAEQEASFLAQMGLDKPVYLRYLYWLTGSDWHASRKVGMPLQRITTEIGKADHVVTLVVVHKDDDIRPELGFGLFDLGEKGCQAH